MNSEDPVNLSTGNFIYEHEDLKVGGAIPLSFHRYYNSKDRRSGVLGDCFCIITRQPSKRRERSRQGAPCRRTGQPL